MKEKDKDKKVKDSKRKEKSVFQKVHNNPLFFHMEGVFNIYSDRKGELKKE